MTALECQSPPNARITPPEFTGCDETVGLVCIAPDYTSFTSGSTSSSSVASRAVFVAGVGFCTEDGCETGGGVGLELLELIVLEFVAIVVVKKLGVGIGGKDGN